MVGHASTCGYSFKYALALPHHREDGCSSKKWKKEKGRGASFYQVPILSMLSGLKLQWHMHEPKRKKGKYPNGLRRVRFFIQWIYITTRSLHGCGKSFFSMDARLSLCPG